MYDPSTLERAHRGSFDNRTSIMQSKNAGCFYCCDCFPSEEITEWWEEDVNGQGQTAVCPQCGIDAVIADVPNTPTKNDFLRAMKAYYFWPD